MYMEESRIVDDRAPLGLSSAWGQVAAIVDAVDAALGRWLADHYGIGLTEYRAALHLSRQSDRELRITELAHRIGLNQSSVTRLVNRMEAKKLVTKDTCPDDARGVYAVITDHGLESVATIREPFETKIRDLLRTATKHYPQLDLAHLDRSFELIAKIAE